MIKLLLILSIFFINDAIAQPGNRNKYVHVRIYDDGINIIADCCSESQDSSLCIKAEGVNGDDIYHEDTLWLDNCWSEDINDYYLIHPSPFRGENYGTYVLNGYIDSCDYYVITIKKSTINEPMKIHINSYIPRLWIEYQPGDFCYNKEGLLIRKEE